MCLSLDPCTGNSRVSLAASGFESQQVDHVYGQHESSGEAPHGDQTPWHHARFQRILPAHMAVEAESAASQKNQSRHTG